jgi:hypothetical protein
MRYLLASILLLGLAWAQPLAELAPPESALTLGWSFEGNVLETLKDDVAALPWEGAKATLEKLMDVFGRSSGAVEGLPEGDLGSFWMDMLGEICPGAAFPAFPEDYRERYPRGAPSEALLTVSLSPFSPLPVLSGVLRLEGEMAAYFEGVQTALLECLETSGDGELVTLEQDGVTFYVIGNAGDFPLAVGNQGGVFYFSSNPEVLRGVIRRIGGADEPSLADSPLYASSSARFTSDENALTLSLDFGVLANSLDAFGPMLVQDEAGQYLLTRSSAMLRTLGGFAAQLSTTPEGVVSESLLAPNPEGGDAALLSLIACERCSVSSPRLAPSSAVAAATYYLPWREFGDYIQDWLDGFEAATGERLDVSAILRDELGVELTPEMFDWLGSEVHTFTLESVSPDLRTLIFNPAQVTVIPVSSPQAAEDALAAWGAFFRTLSSIGMPSETSDAFTDAIFQADVREMRYGDAALTRVRFGPNLDVAYGFLGNYLVLGTPSGALRSIIDTYQGARGLADTPLFQDLRRGLPERVSGLAYSDDRAQLLGLRDLAATLVQPLAFVTQAGLQSWLEDQRAEAEMGEWTWDDEEEWEDDWNAFQPYDADLTGVTPTPLAAPGQVQGELDIDAGVTATYYELTGISPGDTVEVRLSSDTFDTFLALIDPGASLYLNENDDDGMSTNSVLTFTAEEGATYWLEVTSYWGDAIGDYTVTTTVTPGGAAPETTPDAESQDTEPADMGHEHDTEGMDDPEMAADDLPTAEDLPTFSELLDLYDLLPQLLEVLADHLSTSESYTVQGEDGVYSRTLMRIRW